MRTKSTEARRFHAKVSPLPSSRPGVSASSLIKILDGETEVGSYERNYPNFGEQTFEPFELNGAWYALYS